MRDSLALPVLLGGLPVRPTGPPDWPGAWPEVTSHIQRLMKSGGWGKYHGPECAGLVEALRERFHQEHVILCSSGTAAVELALRGCRISSGDEVLLAGYDFPANFKNVLLLGGTPKLVDIRGNDGQLDVDQVVSAFSERTKAVIASHLHGGRVDIPRLMTEASRRGVLVIEDACQSAGGAIEDRPLGAWGDVGVLSFGGSKLLTAGRGGAVLTNRAEIAQRIKLYQHRGNEAYPLSELQAGVLRPQLELLDEHHRRRAAWVARLSSLLTEDCGLELMSDDAQTASSAFYKVGIWYRAECFAGLTRSQFAVALQAEGFAVFPGFRALHRCHARRRYERHRSLPMSERADESLLVLHHPLLLEPLETVDELLAAIRKLKVHAEDLRLVLGTANEDSAHDE